MKKIHYSLGVLKYQNGKDLGFRCYKPFPRFHQVQNIYKNLYIWTKCSKKNWRIGLQNFEIILLRPLRFMMMYTKDHVSTKNFPI